MRYIRECLLIEFPSNFEYDFTTKQLITSFMKENSNSKRLNDFPVYILRYVESKSNKNVFIEKVLLECNDDGVFPHDNLHVLILKDGHFYFYNVRNFEKLFTKIDCPMVNQKRRNKGR